MNIKDLELVGTDADVYDGFNKFMLSADRKVFGKLLARTLLFQKVRRVPGDIVECGVFKGTGLFSFLKLKRYFCPNTGKKVVGFDFFNSEALIGEIEGTDKEAMATLFEERDFEHAKGFKDILERKILASGFEDHEFELVEGDIGETAYDYVEDRPGMRISLLYLDLDLAKPTWQALDALWDRVSKGGIVVFDEYGFHKWSEAVGVDEFFKDKGVEIQPLDYICPTAFVVK